MPTAYTRAMTAEGQLVDVPTWDQRILALVDVGIDTTLIDENLRRTPTERLRRMQDMARFLEAARERRPAPA